MSYQYPQGGNQWGPQSAPGYGYQQGYQQPGYPGPGYPPGFQQGYAPAKPSGVMGGIALVLAILGGVLGVGSVYWTLSEITNLVRYVDPSTVQPDDPLIMRLTVANVLMWCSVPLGLIGLILGIVAMATGRGRVAGGIAIFLVVAAIVAAVILANQYLALLAS